MTDSHVLLRSFMWRCIFTFIWVVLFIYVIYIHATFMSLTQTSSLLSRDQKTEARSAYTQPLLGDTCNYWRFVDIFKQFRIEGPASRDTVTYTGCVQGMSFLPQPGPVTALASFPGSGNTWMRHLLQEITGVYTGSVYHDAALRSNLFPAENITDGSVLAVKTHYPLVLPNKAFDRVVLLTRDPYDSILSAMKFMTSGHVCDVNMDIFKHTVWQEYVSCNIKSWKMFHQHWLSYPGPLLIVRYEDVKKDVLKEILKVTTFLKRQVDTRGIECLLANSEGNFHRVTEYERKAIHYYNNDMVDEINDTREYVERLIRRRLITKSENR